MGLIYDFMFFLILVFETILGFFDGFCSRFSRLIGLFLSIIISSKINPLLVEKFLSKSDQTSATQEFAIWFISLLSIALLFWLGVLIFEIIQNRKIGGGFISFKSHLSGSIIGGIHAIILICIASWSYTTFQQLSKISTLPTLEKARTFEFVESINSSAIAKTVLPKFSVEQKAEQE